MADEEEGGPVRGLELVEQVEHGGLHRHVERRGDFVTEHDLGPGGKGARHGHALFLAPR